jgi:hypothetical protein
MPRLNSEIIKIIHTIEKKVDFNALTLCQMNVWPIIRLAIWEELNNSTIVNKKNVNQNTRLSKATLSQIVLNYVVSFKAIQVLLKYSNKEWILFISRERDQVSSSGGRKIDQVLDPILDDCLNRKLNCLKLQVSPKDKKSIYEFPSLNFFLIFHALINSFLKLIYKNRVCKIIQEVEQKVSSVGDLSSLSLYEIEKDLYLFIKHYLYYRIIFFFSNPKLIFLSCYYSNNHFGLIAAAKVNNLPTVEVQHGKQGRDHVMYSSWILKFNQPLLVPDYFLIWGRKSKKQIQNSCSSGFLDKHKPIVIGNMWASMKSKFPQKYVSKRDIKFVESIQKFKYKVLVSLQPKEDYFPNFLVELINLLSVDFSVLIRFHPSMKVPKNFMDKFRKTKCFIEYKESTKCDLHFLLSKINFHLTAYSSVCYEALIYNVPTLIFSKEGQYLYAEEIEKKIFYYSEDYQQMYNIVVNRINQKHQYKEIIERCLNDPYIIIDPVTVKRNFNLFLKNIL